MDQGRARVYHLDTGDKTAMKKTEGRWTLDMRFLPDRQMERPMRKRANKREAAEVVAVEPDRHYHKCPQSPAATDRYVFWRSDTSVATLFSVSVFFESALTFC